MAQTVTARLQVEIDPIKGSRFVATIVPVASEEEARAVLEAFRVADPNATHHCSAWRIATPNIERAHDDGEPSGSAGRPILSQLQGRDVVDAIAVVTRYYGGTKLGVGGLVRAYGAAAAAALDAADLVERVERSSLRLHHGYEDSARVEQVLARFEATTTADFGAAVLREVELPAAAVDPCIVALRDATAGRIRIERPDTG